MFTDACIIILIIWSLLKETETLLKREANLKEVDVPNESVVPSESDVSQALAAYKRWLIIYPFECFFVIECHAVPDRNPGPGYNTLLLRLIPGDLYSAWPDRQFHTLPGLLHR